MNQNDHCNCKHITRPWAEPCLSCENYSHFETGVSEDFISPSCLVNPYAQIFQSISDLLRRKDHDYGKTYDELRDEYGESIFLIHLSEKLKRLKSLHKQTAQVKEESMDDTIRDIIGYCTLELRYRGERHLVND